MRERTQRSFPSEEKECCTHITPRGGNGEATSGRKKEIVADRVIFLLSTAHSTGRHFLFVIVGYFPLQWPPTGSSSLGRVVTVVYKKFYFLTALQRLNKKYSFRA